jgi:hypothetical protein
MSDMNKPFKIKSNDYDNIYFGSDFHFNHQREFVWKPRGFQTYQEHDKFIEEQCESLTENDLLIYLGDYSLNTTDEQTSALLHKTKAKMLYVYGNHEGYHTRFYKNSLDNFYKKFINLNAVTSGLSEDHASLHGMNFISALPFQIFPFSVDKTTKEGFAGMNPRIRDRADNTITYLGEEGYFQIGNMFYFCRHMAPLIWDKMKYDNYVCLCGHSHSNSKQLNIDNQEGKILDIGMDNAMIYNGSAFLKIEEVDAIMKTKSIKIYDHHGDDNV